MRSARRVCPSQRTRRPLDTAAALGHLPDVPCLGVSSRAAHTPYARSRLGLPAKGGSASMFSRTSAGVPAGVVISAEFG
jgi:hypothetical protein